MDNKKRPNRRRNDSIINYVMIALIVLLVIALIGYILASIFMKGDKNKVTESKKESVSESIDENKKPLNTISESEKETETESENETETETETERETETETEVETETETEVETETETETEAEPEPAPETETEPEPTPDAEIDRGNYSGNVVRQGNRTQDNPYAAIASDEEIRNASDAELVDMIIRGDLGYGKERVDILNLHGIDVNHISNLVNQKLAQ